MRLVVVVPLLTLSLTLVVLAQALAPPAPSTPTSGSAPAAPVAPLAPIFTTQPVANDADDPAVWINRRNPGGSLIVATNKVAAPDGGLYVFGLDGAVRQTVTPLDRPNNVDIEYALDTPDGPIDIAVATERLQSRLRVYRIAENGLTAIDGGGIPVLAGQTGEAAMPMGIALYKRPRDGAIFAIVAPKTGPASGYLWQYRLTFNRGTGTVRGAFVRRFGTYSGTGEIEAVAVDDALNYVYFSDEQFAVRKWHADPDHPQAGQELAAFGRDGFTLQREGIAILERGASAGYIVVSDQIPGGSVLRVFRRQGEPGRPHEHRLLAGVPTSADTTDGVDVIPSGIDPRFPEGAVIMMNSGSRNFQVYDWRSIAAALPTPPVPATR